MDLIQNDKQRQNLAKKQWFKFFATEKCIAHPIKSGKKILKYYQNGRFTPRADSISSLEYEPDTSIPLAIIIIHRASLLLRTGKLFYNPSMVGTLNIVILLYKLESKRGTSSTKNVHF